VFARFFRSNEALLQQYIREVKRHPPLDIATERYLIRRAQKGSRTAINRLVSANLLFVIKIAYKYRNQGMELEDIISAGNLGLIQAALRMEPARQNKFITYAVWWIRQSIRQAIFNQSRLIRLASNKEEKIKRMYRYSFPVKSYIGGVSLDWEKLEEKLGKDSVELLEIMQFIEPPMSFDYKVDRHHKRSLMETLASDEATPEEVLQQKEREQCLMKASRSLDKREYKILHEYYGLRNTKRMSLSQIGETINLSKERVRQLKDQALKKLRFILRDQQAYSLA
jgi:RNA polymerase primary sigma factor